MKNVFLILLALTITTAGFAQKKLQTLNIASYNLRYNNKGDGINAWPNRKENVKALIRFHE